MYHTAIIKNDQTGQFHLMPFRPAPRPSETVSIGNYCRHRSVGNTKKGFCTLAAAEEQIARIDSFWATGMVFEWDGKESAATTSYFPFEKQMELATNND